ncbi:PilZ domain-containing protein [Alteromonadaceae bacterium BrNp21-10]|nr:PilZ domain-containing protein [Alteromonadaceae bacterium BrNp21-10]
MTQEFEEYYDLIEQLKPVIHEPDFNQILASVASHLPKNKRFILKMELFRLAKSCQRLIDLRGLVDAKCSPYEYDGITHFLDDVAVEVFERQIRSFGHFTIGVYEAVNNTENNFRVMHQKAVEQKDDDKTDDDAEAAEATPLYPAQIITFSSGLQRTEERMNFAVNVELLTELNETIAATTIDMSLTGLKVKVNNRHLFKLADTIHVNFRGLNTNNSLQRNEGIIYQIIEIEHSRKEQRIALRRPKDSPAKTKFDDFLQRFIHGNKRRYKVNMDNTVESILSKGYEQYYIPHFTSLPIFLNEQHQAQYILTNDSNRSLLHYWSNESDELCIERLFKRERMASLLQHNITETYVYSFIRQHKEKTYFYSATLDELNKDSDLKHLFFAYGSRRASWRVFKLQLSKIDPQQCHIPSSLPDTLGSNIKKLNAPPPPRLMSRLMPLQHIALLTDITQKWNTVSYQLFALDKSQLPRLKQFINLPDPTLPKVSLHRFKYQNLRRQMRFKLRTKVVVSLDDVEIEGITEDISVGGVKIELSRPYTGGTFDDVDLSFPQLQRVSKNYQLKRLPYEVRNISKDNNVLHLQAFMDDRDKISQLFFEQLIKANRSKLQSDQDEEAIPGLGEALRNLYSNNILNIGIFLKKDGVSYKPDCVAIPKQSHSILPLLRHNAEANKLNLYPLYQGQEPPYLQQQLRSLKNNSPPTQAELLIAYNADIEESHLAIKVKFVDQFNNDKLRQDFIRKAMGGGVFIAIKIFLSRTGRPDIDVVRAEMQYVGQYAIHKAKSLEEQLWNVTGVGDLLDVTDEVLTRYQFNQQHIANNRAALQAISNKLPALAPTY